MRLKTSSIIIFTLLICQSFAYLINRHNDDIDKKNGTIHHRVARSGGFPKFPVAGSIDGLPYRPAQSRTCGQRRISLLPQERTPKIVGGFEPPYGFYPWQVDIKMYKTLTRRYNHHCGGAMIGPRLVLTAAHCLTPSLQLDQLRVSVGEHQLGRRDEHENVFRVDKVVVHPDFRKVGPYSHDIALLRLTGREDGVPFNKFVSPICLPQVEESPPPGTWCSVTGWGAQNGDNLDSLPDILRAADVPVLDLETCRRPDIYGGRQQPILDTMICAGRLQGGVDACGGDSGGPMSCEIHGRHVLSGIVSWGDGCAKKNRPGVYTRVASYVQWIRDSANKLGVEIS